MISFKLFSTKINIDFLFSAAAAFALILRGECAAALFAVLIHELGHIAAMFALKVPPLSISFHLFGIDIERGPGESFLKDAAVSLAGPAVNLAAALLGSRINLALCVLHLLPVMSLDGGSALYSFLCVFFKRETALNIVYIISFIVLIPLTYIGFWILIRSRNFGLLLLCVYLMLSLVFRKENYL